MKVVHSPGKPKFDEAFLMKEPNNFSPYRSIIALFLCLYGSGLLGQNMNLGIPPVWNFSKRDYLAGTQNWDAAQDRRGVLYWANNEGLLQYDGQHWDCFPVANKTVVRSVAIDGDGRIFVGAQSELGYFFPDRGGALQYHSLIGMLPQTARNFEDVWDIQFMGKEVFFRTNKVIFQYNGTSMKIHEPGGELTAMFTTKTGLLVQKNFRELLIYKNDIFLAHMQIPALLSPLTGAIPWAGDTVLFSSLKNGFFYCAGTQSGSWATRHDALFREKRIYTAVLLPNAQIAIGTSLDGFIVLDQKRRITLHLTKKNGIQNNNILSTFNDRAGNVWLGLDNGIDCVVLDAPFQSIIPDGDLQGTGYAASVFQDQLYLGVSNGVYRAPMLYFYDPEKGPFFQKIKATDGQVWALQELEGNLLLGHHEGAFRLDRGAPVPIFSETGAWTFVQLNAEYMLGGTYSGLVLFRKTGNAWAFDQKLDGIEESCRIMAKDGSGAVWISHPYRGLYRIRWSDSTTGKLDIQFFNGKNGLPSDLNNFVFVIASKAVIATEKGVLRYDDGTGTFQPDDNFNQYLGPVGRIRYLKEDLSGNIWYVSETETGVLEVKDLGINKEVKKRAFPELSEKMVGGFEFVYPIDKQHLLFGTEQGFIHYDAAINNPADTQLTLVIAQVSAYGSRDSNLFWGWFSDERGLQPEQTESQIPVLEAGMNNLRFAFSATDYKAPAFLQYRFWMKGMEQGWSEWSDESKRNFTNLSPGDYTFMIQARRKDGLVSSIKAYSFRIRPPWYISTAAKIMYGMGIVGLFVSFLWRQQRKFEREKVQLTAKHQEKEAAQQREVELSKAAVTEIQNEKLEAEIRFNNQELAMATMHLVQKGEMLLTVQENLNKILNKASGTPVKKDIQQLLNILNFDAQLDEDWQHFAFHFDQVHVDFLKRLQETHPQLGSNDYKLCAYLRMNLSTKEIAPLMNISVRGVEASRYRLRKKLNLPNDANLTDFMLQL